MISRFLTLACLTGMLLTSPGGRDSDAQSSLSLRISPRFAHAPALVRVRVDIEPSAGNRQLIVSAESDRFYRSSAIQLAGDESPRIHEFQYPGLPSGQYVLQAELYGARGPLASQQQEFVIIEGIGGDR